MTNKYATKSTKSDGKSDGKVLNLYNKYRTSDKYNKSDAVARIANEAGYSQKEVRGILRDSEKAGKYVYSRKIDGILANEIYDMKKAGADAGLISGTLGISERSVYKHNKAIVDENIRRSNDYNGSVSRLDDYRLRAVGADAAAGESGRERMLRRKREASQSRLPAIAESTPEAQAAAEAAQSAGASGPVLIVPPRADMPAAPEVHVRVDVEGTPAVQPYAAAPEVVPVADAGKVKKKKPNQGQRLKEAEKDIHKLGDAIYGTEGHPGVAENLEGLSKRYDEFAGKDGPVARLNETINDPEKGFAKQVNDLHENVTGEREGTVGGKLKDLKETAERQGELVRKIGSRMPGIVERILPYVAVAGLGVAGWFGYDALSKKLDALDKKPAAVAYDKEGERKFVADSVNQVKVEINTGLDEKLKAQEARQAEKDKGLEGKLGEINANLEGLGKNYDGLSKGQQDLGEKYDTLNKAVADEAKARETGYEKLDKSLRTYTDKVADGINRGVAVLERTLHDHINAGNKPVVDVAPVAPAVGDAPVVPAVSAPAKPADYAEFSVYDGVGNNANEARAGFRVSKDGLTLNAQALDSRHATELGRTDLSAGRIGVDYKGDGWSVGGRANVGIETESRNEGLLSVDNVNDGTVLSVADDYNSSENRASKLGSFNVHGSYNNFTLGLTGTRRESKTRDNITDNTLVTFDSSTGLVPLAIDTNARSRSKVTTDEFRVEAGVKPVDGVYAALIGGNSVTHAGTSLIVNGSEVPVESQTFNVPTVGGKADVSVGQLDAGVIVLGHFGNDIPSDSKFDTNVYAVIDRVVADLSLGAEATFKDGGAVGGGMLGRNVDRKALKNVMGTRAENDLFSLEYFERQNQLRIYDALWDAIDSGDDGKISALLAVRAGRANSDGRKVLGVEAGVRVPKIITDGGVAGVISYTQQSGGELTRQKTIDAGLELLIDDSVRAGIGVMFDQTDGKKTVTPGIGLTIKSKK